MMIYHLYTDSIPVLLEILFTIFFENVHREVRKGFDPETSNTHWNRVSYDTV